MSPPGAIPGTTPASAGRGRAPRRSRRELLRRAGTAAVALGPWPIARSALSSSGSLRVALWADYRPWDLIGDFAASTGIRVSLVQVRSNEHLLALARGSGEREPADVLCPSHVRSGDWAATGLLAPWRADALERLDGLNPTLMEATAAWRFGDEAACWLPHVWGSEGIAWRDGQWEPPDGPPSYADPWSEAAAGRAMLRPWSGMVGAGLHLESEGVLQPGDVANAYGDEDTMRRVWATITGWCIARKSRIRLFWTDASSLAEGLDDDRIVVGQAWDRPARELASDGRPLRYRAPVEGALAWVDGLALAAGSRNVEQAHAFADFCLDPQRAGRFVEQHGYASAVEGAERHAGQAYLEWFEAAWPDDAVRRIRPWPYEPRWFTEARTRFRNRFVNA